MDAREFAEDPKLTPGFPPEDGKKIDLSGSWRVVYSELNGEMTPVAHFSGIVITYKESKFTIEVNGVIEHEGTFLINEEQDPAQIVYTYQRSSFYETGVPRVGIVQLTGDTFKDCLGAIGAKAPRSFNTTVGSDLVQTIHQRVGAERGTGLRVSLNKVISEW